MKLRIGWKLVNAMQAFSEWLARKATRLNVTLSMEKYQRDNGHL